MGMEQTMQGGDGTVLVSGPWGGVRSTPEAIQRMAKERFDNVMKAAPWLTMLGNAANSIVAANVSHKKRLEMLRKLADRVNAAVAPQSACKSGCSACCHIRAEVSEWEANLIGREIGIAPKQPSVKTGLHNVTEAVRETFGKPCVFLRDQRCSIYESRPISCRLHHNLSADASQCQIDVEESESFVPGMNLSELHMAYAMCSGTTWLGDVRDFWDHGPGQQADNGAP